MSISKIQKHQQIHSDSIDVKYWITLGKWAVLIKILFETILRSHFLEIIARNE